MGAHKRGDRGETLIEVVISVVVMSTAVVAVMGALATSIIMSDIHRKQSKAGAYLRAFAEAIQTSVAGSPSAYANCAATSAYSSAYASGDADFITEILAVNYWDGSTFAGTCTTDSGVQRISLRVRSVDGRAAERLDVIIRKPCRSTVAFPADAPCG